MQIMVNNLSWIMTLHTVLYGTSWGKSNTVCMRYDKMKLIIAMNGKAEQ